MGKGENFEREICRVLSSWWTNHERDDIFWRSRLRRTKKSPNARHQLGDLRADDPRGFPLIDVFNIELKCGYSKNRSGKKVRNVPWDVLDLIDYTGASKTNSLLHFWNQTLTDATISSRIPLLIFKRDYHVPVVCMYFSTFLTLKEYVGEFTSPSIKVTYGDNDLIMIRLSQFLDWLTPEVVIQIWKKFNEI